MKFFRCSFLHTLICCIALSAAGARALDASVVFDNANKAYEQRRFTQAAQLYEQVLASGVRTANVYFNLGSAYYKAGELGRAIAAFRNAERLAPRDADLRANLALARKKVSESYSVALWRECVRFLTVNEWTASATFFFWAFFLLLAVQQWRGARLHRPLASVLAAALVICGTGLTAALYDALTLRSAVIVAKEAPARFGPLTDSQVSFQLRDGAEVVITDAKNDWVQIRDASGRHGWIKQDEILLVGPPPSASGNSPQS